MAGFLSVTWQIWPLTGFGRFCVGLSSSDPFHWQSFRRCFSIYYSEKNLQGNIQKKIVTVLVNRKHRICSLWPIDFKDSGNPNPSPSDGFSIHCELVVWVGSLGF